MSVGCCLLSFEKCLFTSLACEVIALFLILICPFLYVSWYILTTRPGWLWTHNPYQPYDGTRGLLYHVCTDTFSYGSCVCGPALWVVSLSWRLFPWLGGSLLSVLLLFMFLETTSKTQMDLVKFFPFVCSSASFTIPEIPMTSLDHLTLLLYMK